MPEPARRSPAPEAPLSVPPAIPRARSLFWRWIGATWLGWLAGVGLILLLAAVGGVLGVPETQFSLGIGMGAGVGYLQGRVTRDLAVPRRSWAAASLVGMGVPFVVSDVVATVWDRYVFWPVAVAAVAGLCAGFLQARALRACSTRAVAWAPACAASWAAAVGAVLLPSFLASQAVGPIVLLASLAGIVGGGLVLGVASGAALVLIANR